MGNEQTKKQHVDSLASPNRDRATSRTGEEDGDLPYAYTSYSIDKHGVVDNEDQIAIVKTNVQARTTEPELEALSSIPYFYPIIRGTVGYTSEEDSHLKDRIDPKLLIMLVGRFQEHLKECGIRVSAGQMALAEDVVSLEKNASGAAKIMKRKAVKMQSYEEKLRAVSRLNETLQEVEETIQKIIPLMTHVNNMFPEESRLEPFSLQPIGEEPVTSDAEIETEAKTVM